MFISFAAAPDSAGGFPKCAALVTHRSSSLSVEGRISPTDRRVDVYNMKRTNRMPALSTPSKSPRLDTDADNSGGDGESHRMKVCVRVRPFTEKELKSGQNSVIDIVDENILVFDPTSYDGRSNDQYQYHGKVYREIGKRANKNMQFEFDRVFNDTENNLAVYTETTKDLVASLLAGYNCSVFAYGSTGSGKTHTMLGSLNDPGVIFFTTMDLYKNLEEEKNKNLEISISYFEIYNEVIYDLLDPTTNKPLSVLDNGNKGMSVKNLSIHQPNDAEHLLEMLKFGNQNRKQDSTDANSQSSRSHAIFQITLRRKDFTNNQDMSIQVSKMSLIDLAGSERASVAYKSFRSEGLCREGGNINRSLLALGNCINALTTAKSSYIPYRSSKLTLILRDSLGGNCQTLMIATVAPSAMHYEEIHNTLLYAQRAKGIQLNARKNTISIGAQTRDYKHMFEQSNRQIATLKQQNDDLKKEIEKLKNRCEAIPDDPIVSSTDAVQKLHSVKNILDDYFKQRLELRAKFMDCEHNLKLLDLRLLFRNFDAKRLQLLENDENGEKSNTIDALHSIYQQKLHYADQRSQLVKDMEENESKIRKLERELMDKTNDDIVIRSYFAQNDCIAQTKDMDFAEKHHNKIVEEICSKYEANEELTSDTVEFVYRAYHVLNGLDRMSEEMESKFKNIIQKLKGKKSVVWRDDVDSNKANKTKELVNLMKIPIYQSSMTSPSEKRSLVAIRDITPIERRNVLKENPNIGNTVIKGRIAVISPKPHMVERNTESDPIPFPRYNFRENQNTTGGGGGRPNWNRGFYGSNRKRQFNHYNNQNNNGNGYFNNNNNDPQMGKSPYQKPNSFSYNSKFRPRFRF